MANDTVRTEFVDTEDMRFEVDMCGDDHSDRLALLLHGFPELSFSWRYQMPLLARLGYKVWAPNQRGYGNTTRPTRIADYRMHCLAGDVAGLIDASGCSSVTLIAHDWGGAVAWVTAMRKVRPLERLIILNLPHPTRFAEHLRTWAQLKRSWYIFFFQLPWLPEFALRFGGARVVGKMFRGMAIDKSRFPEKVLDVYRRHALQPGAATAMINWYRAIFRGGRAEAREMQSPPIIETPTLMIWGEQDAALGKELTYGTERFVRELTIRYLPGVSHWVQQEAPEAVNAMIEAWLTGRPVPEAEWGGKLRAG